MNRKEELNKLKEDEHYYGKFGKAISKQLRYLNAINKPFGAWKTNETNSCVFSWRLFSHSYT